MSGKVVLQTSRPIPFWQLVEPELRECGKWAEPEEVEAASPIKNIEPDLALVAPETMREDPWVEPWWRRFWRKKKGLFRKEGTD